MELAILDQWGYLDLSQYGIEGPDDDRSLVYHDSFSGYEPTTVQHPLSPANMSTQDTTNNNYDLVNSANGTSPYENNQHPASSNLLQSAALGTEQASTKRPTRNKPVGQALAGTNNDVQPLRDSEGRMICSRDGCGQITFRRRHAWRTHMDQHDRPFKCDVTDCTHIDGFSTRGELKRHVNSLHKKGTIYCTVPTCPRSSSSGGNNPFSRKDNLQDHMIRKHPNHRSPTKTADMKEGSGDAPDDDKEMEEHESSGSKSAFGSGAEQPFRGTRKRRRFMKREPSSAESNNGGLNDELRELREENKILKRELELYKKMVEKLLE
ncbi:hypothetical protein DM02DRAFT_668617 [Periconia macrospinosa]|uniref:C2H2-type domain-containing protein n=1 Tax=Periconia macrospinosa TaxID=97972 RepID=A0A2V1E4A0_9PLEO|nr:hypothetical protein DM02DRAFT_668617 [Periconia macrospinosa]